MSAFIKKTLLFFTLFLVLAGVCLLLPPTPRIKRSNIYGKLKKDSLLQNVMEPRIVFVGGSNLPFGLNGSQIHNALGLYPINTGIMHTVGLKAMVQNYLQFARPKDIVVLSPEYSHFFGDFMNGHESTLYYSSVDNPINPFYSMDFDQIKQVSPYMLKYIFKKLDPREYKGFSISPFFNNRSFNRYGDIEKHWKMKPRKFASQKEFKQAFNEEVIDYIVAFQKQLEKKQIELFFSPPPFNRTSAEYNSSQVKHIENALLEAGIPVLGKCQEYVFADSLFFNSTYHLIKEGVDKRTTNFINDYKSYRLTNR